MRSKHGLDSLSLPYPYSRHPNVSTSIPYPSSYRSLSYIPSPSTRTPSRASTTASTLSLTNPIAPTAPTNAHGTTNSLSRGKHPQSLHDKDTNTSPNRQIPLPFRTTRLLRILTLNTLSHSSGNQTNLPPLPNTHQENFHLPQQLLHHRTMPNLPTHRTQRPPNSPTPLLNSTTTRPRLHHGLLLILTPSYFDSMTPRSPT